MFEFREVLCYPIVLERFGHQELAKYSESI